MLHTDQDFKYIWRHYCQVHSELVKASRCALVGAAMTCYMQHQSNSPLNAAAALELGVSITKASHPMFEPVEGLRLIQHGYQCNIAVRTIKHWYRSVRAFRRRQAFAPSKSGRPEIISLGSLIKRHLLLLLTAIARRRWTIQWTTYWPSTINSAALKSAIGKMILVTSRRMNNLLNGTSP